MGAECPSQRNDQGVNILYSHTLLRCIYLIVRHTAVQIYFSISTMTVIKRIRLKSGVPFLTGGVPRSGHLFS